MAEHPQQAVGTLVTVICCVFGKACRLLALDAVSRVALRGRLGRGPAPRCLCQSVHVMCGPCGEVKCLMHNALFLSSLLFEIGQPPPRPRGCT